MMMNSDKLCGNVMNSVQRIGCILMVNSACVCHQCEKLILYIRLYFVKNLYMCSESRETVSSRINSTPMDRVVMVTESEQLYSVPEQKDKYSGWCRSYSLINRVVI